MSSKTKLPKAELIQGDIDFPEMIKKDFKKALLIFILSSLATILTTVGIYLLLYFF